MVSTENQASERSEIVSEVSRESPSRASAETENKNKNEGHEEVQCDLLHELLDWLQEFRENLVVESRPFEPRENPGPGHRDTSSFSHELPMESRAKVEWVGQAQCLHSLSERPKL